MKGKFMLIIQISATTINKYFFEVKKYRCSKHSIKKLISMEINLPLHTQVDSFAY